MVAGELVIHNRFEFQQNIRLININTFLNYTLGHGYNLGEFVEIKN